MKILKAKNKRTRYLYLHQGGNYQWYERECVADTLEIKPNGDHIISYRPLAGTSELEAKYIVATEPTEDAVQLPKTNGRAEAPA